MKDQFDRTIDYMRVSITDRCNLRCRYCMPDGIERVPMQEILTYEEIAEIAEAAAECGITRIKVTGGEPLARRSCAELIRMLKAVPGIRQVTLTTNGVLLGQELPRLLEAGLDAVNISLDTLQRDRYQAITGKDELPRVLESLAAAVSAGLPVKLNAVLQKGVNDEEWYDLVQIAKDQPVPVRFIEIMPIGYGKQITGISNQELYERLKECFPDVAADETIRGNGPAVYVKIPGFRESIGFISAIHGKFCGSCNRIRLTAQGKLKPCLCYGETFDLMPVLRQTGAESSGELRKQLLTQVFKEAVFHKPAAHCFEEAAGVTEKNAMSRIGG